MIDKINANGSYDYPRHNNSQRKSTAVQAYENTPGTKEAAGKKASGSRSAGGSTRPADRDRQGVFLDLSAKGRGRAAAPEKSRSWLKGLRRLFAPVLLWLKNFWESDTAPAEHAGPAAQEDENLQPEMSQAEEDSGIVQTEAAEELGELPPLDEMGQAVYGPEAEEAVKSGSLQRVEQMLTRNGTRRLAHNSDLLTYYDRRGRIVEIDDTQKHRVLYGDKNILKL